MKNSLEESTTFDPCNLKRGDVILIPGYPKEFTVTANLNGILVLASHPDVYHWDYMTKDLDFKYSHHILLPKPKAL